MAGDRLPPEFVEHTFENAASYIGSFCLSMINTTLSSASSLAIGAIVTALYACGRVHRELTQRSSDAALLHFRFAYVVYPRL